MRRTGISNIGDVPWGTHFCQFYEHKQDLIDILVPYFKSGLENNEFCMWVTSEPLGVDEAKDVLARQTAGLRECVRKGQLEILDYSQWYTLGGGFDADRVLDGWMNRLEWATRQGFEGLRLTGNTFWLEKSDWCDFTQYEAVVDRVIGRHKMLALCTYSLAKCGAVEIMDVVANHAYALVKRAGEWQVIESAERRRIEASLRHSEERYRSLFEQMTEGFAVHEIIRDENGTPCDYRFLEVNPAFGRLTGLNGEFVAGKTMREVLPGEDPKWIRTYGEVATTGNAVHFDDRAESLGRHYDVLAYRSAPEQFAVLFTDITERKRAEEALRESEEKRKVALAVQAEWKRFKDILDNLPSLVCLLTPDYHVPFANRLFREQFGESNGRHCFEYVSHRESPCEQCQSFEVLQTNTPHNWEWHGDNGEILDVFAIPFTDPDGSPMILEVNLDVTSRRRAETELARHRDHLEELVRERTAQLETANAQLQADIAARIRAEEALQHTADELRRSNADLEQFAYVSSHDLQEPLRMVAGFVQLLQSEYGGKLGPAADEYIQFAVDGTRRMRELITDLLAYSRVGRQKADSVSVDANQALDAALQNLRVSIEESRATVSRGKLPVVQADGPQLIQVFQNLIGNAIKFRGPEPPGIQVNAVEDGEFWIFSVKDNGIGIHPEFHEKIFMIFQQLHPKNKYPGTGIGLAVCKKIVERHGGRIWVDSGPGRGSAFYFSLPR